MNTPTNSEALPLTNCSSSLRPMCDAPKDGTPIIVYMGTKLPYVAFVYWDHTLNDGKGAWIYCSEMYSDRPNFITTYPSAWSHILWPTMDELNIISETNV